jgi:hypothetical protein
LPLILLDHVHKDISEAETLHAKAVVAGQVAEDLPEADDARKALASTLDLLVHSTYQL